MKNDGPKTRPSLFIVGQPKSGSTALHQFLGEHPDIFMSEYKEPSYFCSDWHEESDALHGKEVYFPIRAPAQYANLFSAAGRESVVGESSVNYLYSRVAADRIKAFNPEAKIILILRNPADFLFSFYQMNVRRAWESAATFAEALSLEGERKRGNCIPPNVNFPSTLFYRERVRYYDQIDRFRRRFPSGQIRIMVYEDFKQDNARHYSSTLEFLGVDQGFRPEFREVNPSGNLRYSWLNNLVRNRTIIRLAYRLVPQSRHQWVQKRVLKKIFSSSQPTPRLDEGVREELMAAVRPEVEKASELVGIDLLEKWGYGRDSRRS